MAINKVEINGEVKLDLTQDTVTPATLLKGASAHDAAGNPVQGTANAAPTTPYMEAEYVAVEDGGGTSHYIKRAKLYNHTAIYT